MDVIACGTVKLEARSIRWDVIKPSRTATAQQHKKSRWITGDQRRSRRIETKTHRLHRMFAIKIQRAYRILISRRYLSLGFSWFLSARIWLLFWGFFVFTYFFYNLSGTCFFFASHHLVVYSACILHACHIPSSSLEYGQDERWDQHLVFLSFYAASLFSLILAREMDATFNAKQMILSRHRGIVCGGTAVNCRLSVCIRS